MIVVAGTLDQSAGAAAYTAAELPANRAAAKVTVEKGFMTLLMRRKLPRREPLLARVHVIADISLTPFAGLKKCACRQFYEYERRR